MDKTTIRAIGIEQGTTNSAAAWPDRAIVQEALAQISWFRAPHGRRGNTPKEGNNKGNTALM
jgi:hypothetical protein